MNHLEVTDRNIHVSHTINTEYVDVKTTHSIPVHRMINSTGISGMSFRGSSTSNRFKTLIIDHSIINFHLDI